MNRFYIYNQLLGGMNLSKAQVQKEIQSEYINGVTIHYSYAEKSQGTISVFKNDRLLIFNEYSGCLYYINEQTVPFRTAVPKPKNDVANINVSVVKNPPKTNELTVEFLMKNESNQNVQMVWTFYLFDAKMAADWLKIIQDFKTRKIEEAARVDNKPAAKNENPTNKAFIHDTLGFGLMEGFKGSNVKPSEEQSPEKSKIDSQSNANLGQSGLKKSNLNQSNLKGSLKESNLKESNLKGSQNNSAAINGGSRVSDDRKSPSKQPSIQNSRLSDNNKESPSIVKPNSLAESQLAKEIYKSNYNSGNQLDPERNLGNSNIGNSNISRHTNQDSPYRASKLTLRDELQSIMEGSRISQSRYSNISGAAGNSRAANGNSKYNPNSDWNLKFLRKPEESTLLEFEEHALKTFIGINAKDKQSKESYRYYQKEETIVVVTNSQSPEAKKLKSEFRNYHFISESCKNQFIAGVPLSTLIQFEGCVALVKSAIPQSAPRIELTQEISYELKDLERYTRIKNNILKKATLYDLSDLYEGKGKRIIYIDNLVEYLPVHLDENFRGGLMRPEHILDNVKTFMQGGVPLQANRNDMKILNETLQTLKANVRQCAKELSSQDIQFANSDELKDVLHSRGINLKYLPMLYNEVTNKNVKKYLNTVMVAKIAKDNLLETMAQLRGDKSVSLNQTIEDSYRLLLEGNSSVSNEYWKEIALNFRKEYGIPMSNHDIIGGFFLNCLIKLVPAQYDISKINDKKTFFKDEGIILKGFVVKMDFKIKSFYRFTTELTDKIDAVCKEQRLRYNYEVITDELELSKKQVPENFILSNVDRNLKKYMTYFAPPDQFEKNSFPHLKLYSAVNQQPPTSYSLVTTKNYLDYCLDYQQYDTFKQTLEHALTIIDYWFDKNHYFYSDFYESLSNYYSVMGKAEESINFMKESLAISIRNGGISSKNTANRYYELADKQLRAGRKNDSLDNFLKAKSCMETTGQKGLSYPVTLMKLSSLYLNASEFENCVVFAKSAVQRFEQLEKTNNSAIHNGNKVHGLYDQYCIKAIEIMTRAFEIEGKKEQFIKTVHASSAKFNRTTKPGVFEQLIKICLTGTIFKHSLEKCQLFQSFVEKTVAAELVNNNPDVYLNELMTLAEQFNVMERFMLKFESLERIVSDINSRRALTNDLKEFITITKNIVGCVGEEYVYGLCQQKQFQ